MEIKELYNLYCQNFLVDTDTRKIRKNTIFFALKGGNFDGNKFAEEALKKGALFSVIDDERYQTNKKIILVDDVLKTLQELANYHRKELSIPIVGLTGSNGKTTSKELINAVLSKKFNTVATIGNLNNHIGVPLTILSMNKETEIGIVEMGANHHGEIKLLTEIAEPSIGYITNFGKAHLEGFGSVEGVIKAKSELYDFLIAKNSVIIVNPNDKIQLAKTEHTNRKMFCESIKYIDANPFVKLVYEHVEIQSNLIGSYNYANIAAAITIGNYFDVELNVIKEAIEEYLPKNNRSEIIEKNDNKIILDAYNANPTSVRVALENFAKLKTNNDKIVILGDMFELGKETKKEHQEIANLASDFNFSDIYLVGSHYFEIEGGNAIKFKTYSDLETCFSKKKLSNVTVLIKGSRGMALERILDVF